MFRCSTLRQVTQQAPQGRGGAQAPEVNLLQVADVGHANLIAGHDDGEGRQSIGALPFACGTCTHLLSDTGQLRVMHIDGIHDYAVHAADAATTCRF